MKKVHFIVMMVALICWEAFPAGAVEFKMRGNWHFGFDYIDGGNFMSRTRAGAHVTGQQWAAMHQQRDNFEAVQRLFLQLTAEVSENLSGSLFFEVGEQRWGMASQGGSLGADGTMVKVKNAYLDWTVPNTALKLRMGIQGFKLPGFALESPVLDDDVASVTASYRFNDTVSLTGFWVRPYNDNYTAAAGSGVPSGFMDNMDMAGLSLPLRFTGVTVIPWAMVGGLGPNTMPMGVGPNRAVTWPQGNPSSGQLLSGLAMRDGMFPAAFSTARAATRLNPDSYSDMFWGGVTFDITAADPWRFAGDFIYGQVSSDREYLRRQGWFGMLLAEYKTKVGTPGLYGWYFSGDDADPNNGSERLPYISTANNLRNALSSFGHRGSAMMTGGKGVLGVNPSGTWGVGARVKGLTFMENLTHTLRVNYFGGTNDPAMAAYITGRKAQDNSGRPVYRNNTDFNSFGTYLTRNDSGIEINVDSTYQIYTNLKAVLELGYIHLWLDNDVWGKTVAGGPNNLHYKDAWKASLIMIYEF